MNNCPLCNSPDFKEIHSANEHNYERCLRCGLIISRPNSTLEILRTQYLSNLASTTDYYRRTIRQDKITSIKRLKIIDKYTNKGRLLDVGCNIGTFMDEAKDRGWSVSGFEPNREAAEECQRKHPDTFNRFFEDPDKNESFYGTFDLITMTDVIEHFPAPDIALVKVKKYLKNGGLVFIVTPNASNILTRKIQMKPQEHLFLYNQETLKRLLLNSGFDILLCRKVSRYRNFEALKYSSSRFGKTASFFINFFRTLKLDNLISAISFHCLRDELLVIAKKKR